MVKLYRKEKKNQVKSFNEFLVRIDDTKNVIATRQVDHKGYSDRLTTENNNFSMN
jgi:hypothetical protein